MNRAVQGVYEPGSTFKIVTASAAMEEHVFSPTDLIDASAGVWRSGSRRVTEAKNHNYGVLSFTDVLVKSSNVGRHQDRTRRRRRAAGPLRAPVRIRRTPVHGPARRDARHAVPIRPVDARARWRRCRWATRLASRRCRWPRPCRRSPTAACSSSRGSCARCGAARRGPRSRPLDLRRVISRGTAARADHDHGAGGRPTARRRARRCPATRRRQDGHGQQARQRPLLEDRLPRVVCRVRPVAPARADDSRGRRRAARPVSATMAASVRGADLPAHRGRRAAVPGRARRPSIPLPPVLVQASADAARRGASSGTRGGRGRAADRASCPGRRPSPTFAASAPAKPIAPPRAPRPRPRA